ncbi:MAG: RsmE family RNA methyltransferase [Actinomycetota bacterium]|nr:RsmE family RNA methyltransferase [Actinomycetota bacterium]
MSCPPPDDVVGSDRGTGGSATGGGTPGTGPAAGTDGSDGTRAAGGNWAGVGDGPDGTRAAGAELSPAGAGAAAQVFVADVTAPELEPADAHHLLRVLRLRPGEPVVAADGRGAWRVCSFVPGPSPALEPLGDVVRCPAQRPVLTVGFVPVKGERPEWVVQKLTELGVDRVVVLRSARSVVRWDRFADRQAAALERLRRVAESAAAQSRRAWLPTVDGIVGVAGLAEMAAPVPLALAERGGRPPGLDQPVVGIGPEGGWTDDERAVGAGNLVALSDTVLRAETAAVAAGTILCALRSGLVAGPVPPRR